MKVGILGSGDVGKALAKAFLAEGHGVIIATRDPTSAKGKELAIEVPNATVGTFANVAKNGELLVLCTLWSGTESAIKRAKAENFKGKILIDVTNPLDLSGGAPKLDLGTSDSGGEQVQRWLPKAMVVKAFNSIGNQSMYKPDFFGGPPTMFYCGNDATAKKKVKDILERFGWDPVDIGDITGARELEPLCILWVKYGVMAGSWHHAFKLLR